MPDKLDAGQRAARPGIVWLQSWLPGPAAGDNDPGDAERLPGPPAPRGGHSVLWWDSCKGNEAELPVFPPDGCLLYRAPRGVLKSLQNTSDVLSRQDFPPVLQAPIPGAVRARLTSEVPVSRGCHTLASMVTFSPVLPRGRGPNRFLSSGHKSPLGTISGFIGPKAPVVPAKPCEWLPLGSQGPGMRPQHGAVCGSRVLSKRQPETSRLKACP